jgi:FAD/FMN-containing dehydrogenase
VAIETTSRTLDQSAVEAFAAQMRGEVILPDNPAYEEARSVYNGMIDKRPAAIARCRDVADVISALRFGREHGLLIAVRGGGHNVAGKGTCDGGLVIDLAAMNSVRVDPAARTARVGGGALWGDVDHATHAFGMATPSGIISTTGVAGLTLGGGFGYLSRRYGLSLDNVVEADVVTADGSFVTASENENPDLFWALRGGGGNFGIVTSFKFKLYDVSTIYGGPIFYPVDQAAHLLEFYRDWIVDAPREISAFFAVHQGPPAPFIPEALHFVPAAAFVVCYTGDMSKAEDAVKPFRTVAEPALDLMSAMPYPMIQSLFDALYVPGMQHYWKSDVIASLPDGAIEVHARHAPTVPDPWSGVHIYPLNGAIQDTPGDATAFPFRDSLATHNILGINPDPAVAEDRIAWVRRYYEAMRPYSDPGGYVNFMTDEGDARVQAAYRGNYPRLVDVKRKWDPDNVFSVNQNIR